MPATRLVNAKIKLRQGVVQARIHFLTLSGEEICFVERSVPFQISKSELLVILDQKGPFRLLKEDGKPLDMEQGLFWGRPKMVPNTDNRTNAAPDVYNVFVIRLFHQFHNLRMEPDHPCGSEGWTGHRRWYKEFWEFAATATLPLPTAPVVFQNPDDMHKTIAMIMQHKAWEFRKDEMEVYHSHPHIRNPRKYLNRPDPTGRYFRPGVHHSIMRRTKCEHWAAIAFVDEWLDLNKEVVKELAERIHLQPLYTYYA